MTSTATRLEPSPAGTSQAPSKIDQLLRLAASLGASALYLSSNRRPSVRVDGAVQPLDRAPVLGPTEVETLLISHVLLHNGTTRGALALQDWSFDLPAVGRVRCMTFHDGRGPGGVFRIASPDASADDAGALGPDIHALATQRDGLIVVAGSRESGTPTLMRALVDLVNRARRGYIVTVQREISVLVKGEASLISQREARGGLEETLAVARAALQENPDVLVLEEVRSAPLMNLALDAAAGGQLVIVALTASSAAGAIERIVDMYPPDQAGVVQLALAQCLRGAVAQVLVPKIGGGRVAAREVLLSSAAISNVLAAGKVAHLPAAIAAGRNQGVSLTDALVELVRNGVVSPTEAHRHAADSAGCLDEMKRHGIDTSFVHRPA
jgi:twitching motility protein PilT